MRGKQSKKKKFEKDAKYGSEIVAQLINYVMKDGKKQLAAKIVYKAMQSVDKKKLKMHHELSEQNILKNKKEKKGKDKDKAKDKNKKIKISYLEILETALENIKPRLEIRSRRIGGANYQIPVPVSADRQMTLALRWLINIARDNRKNTPYWQSLSREIQAAFNNEGAAIKKKLDTERMAEANKAFAQFA